jgi:hypothetical protein
MKKPVCLLFVCLMYGMIFAFSGGTKGSPAMNNPSIKKSEKDMNKQVGNFQSHHRYSSLVNNHAAKTLKKQQAKTGKGL